MPQLCSLPYLCEVLPAMVNFSAEGNMMTVSHQDDTANRIEFELRPGTRIHNAVQYHEYGSTCFEFEPWTLICLDEQGEFNWPATGNWQVAEQVAGMVAYPNTTT
jgi:hypothetical protein